MRIGALVTARLKSERLPCKALLPICGRELLAWAIERIGAMRWRLPVVVCTSTLGEDDPIEALARRCGAECFRGDPVDVLERLTKAADRGGFDAVVSCTADNPLVDPASLDALLDFHLWSGSDFSRPDGLPLGTFGYALRTTAMRRACALKESVDTEIWGPLFSENPVFSTGVLRMRSPIGPDRARLTVDTPEDLAVVTAVVERLEPLHGAGFGFGAISRLYADDPALFQANRHVRQRQAAPGVARLRGELPPAR